MARKNGHTQLTRGFKPWKSKLKNPPRWRKFFPSLLPLSFCLRLSRAPALPSWNFPFTSGEGCAQNAAASNAALGGSGGRLIETRFLKLHTAPCVSLVVKKKKKERKICHPFSSYPSSWSLFFLHCFNVCCARNNSLSLSFSFFLPLSLSVCVFPPFAYDSCFC